jgi:hypothetical protein
MGDVLDGVRELLRTAKHKFSATVPLFLTIDDWHSGDFTQLLDLLAQLQSESVSILGPSTSELKLIAQGLEKKSNPPSLVPSTVYEDLRAAGISNIEGGSDIKLHADAAAHGFDLTFAHNLVRARLLQHTTSGSAPAASREHVASFLQEIYALREMLLPSNAVQTWSLWSSWLLDSSLPKAEAPLGLEVLHALLLAKLLLPEIPWIRAPLSLVGMRLAEIAAEVGVSDFGYVAADADSARILGLLPWSLVSGEFQAPHELQANISQTSLPDVVYENG